MNVLFQECSLFTIFSFSFFICPLQYNDEDPDDKDTGVGRGSHWVGGCRCFSHGLQRKVLYISVCITGWKCSHAYEEYISFFCGKSTDLKSAQTCIHCMMIKLYDLKN